jgi:hypothetical protein
MSDLPAESVGYQEVVAEYFLGLRGAGLLLSPLDQELVAEWERRGLPVPVVCRGLRHGMAALAEERRGPVRSLRSLRLAVEDEWRAYRSGRVGSAPAPPSEEETALRRIADAQALLLRAATGGSPPANDEAARALESWRSLPGSPLERVENALAAADDALLSSWVRSLSRPERASLGRKLRRVVGPRGPKESRRAHRETLRTYVSECARQSGLISLRRSV